MTRKIPVVEQEVAAGYVLGNLDEAEQHEFEVLLAENLKLQAEVDTLEQTFHEIPQGLTRMIPPPVLQARLLKSFMDLLQTPNGIVMFWAILSGVDGITK